MKRVIVSLFGLLFLIGIYPLCSFAQDDDCCPEEDRYGREDELLIRDWEKQIYDLSDKKEQLLLLLGNYSKDIDALKSQSADMDKKVSEAETGLYSSVGMNINSMAEFRKRFEETEKKINNKLGTPSDARKSYFNEIDASKAKCLPEFYDRYLAMKSKLEAWEKGTVVSKSSNYTVVKGDCLWKIAGKSEIYNKNNYWPKIWEANEEGVVSAPAHTPKKIVNPNLIYPGQVLKIPALTDDDLKKFKDVSYQVKTQRKADDFKKNSKKTSVTKKDVKKDIKKNIKSDTKKDVKKDVKKEVKRDAKQEKKPEIKK